MQNPTNKTTKNNTKNTKTQSTILKDNAKTTILTKVKYLGD